MAFTVHFHISKKEEGKLDVSHFVYNCINALFGGGIVDSMSDWMTNLFSTLSSLMSGRVMNVSMSCFSAIACSFLIFYFLTDMMSQASRDMLTIERFIVSLIKLLVGFAVLLYLKDIISGLFDIGEAMYNLVKGDSFKRILTGSSSSSLELFKDIPASESGRSGYSVMPQWTAATEEAFQEEFGSVLKIVTKIPTLFICVVIFLISLVAKFAGYFICTYNAVMVVSKAVFSPIAVVQVFGEGMRSEGVRYLKSLAADCLTMAVIIIVLYAASGITTGMTANMLSISSVTVSTIDSLLEIKNLTVILVPEVVAVGAMAGGGKIAHEIVGS